MKDARLYSILLTEHVTEKAFHKGSVNQRVYKVMLDATKGEVKKAIETLFGVAVKKVNMVRINGKRKYFKQKQGRRKAVKKAYVTLGDNDEIDFAKLS